MGEELISKNGRKTEQSVLYTFFAYFGEINELNFLMCRKDTLDEK